MDTLLVATKTRIPPRPQRAVPRARLSDTLEQAVPLYALVRLAAPAGYGKTTLLAQWAHASRFRVAWLALGDEDNDLDRFLRYLLAAWETVQRDIRDSPFGLLLGGIDPDRDAVLTAFLNVANDAPDHMVFVLDDYHLIDESAIHQALTFLLDYLPPNLHFVLAGRGRPPLPLARYRARRQLLELRTEDLQFAPEETVEFLNGLMALELTGDQVAALHAQSEGWIAGLQLTALTLQRRSGEEPSVISARRFVAEYVSEDVLARLPQTLRQFLYSTSILDRLSGPLCDAVTAAHGGQEVLDLLERENLFLLALDESHEWFRYHQLFADVLRTELKRRHSAAEIAALHRRAAQWHLEQDLPDQAFAHAVAGGDAELVTQIGERYFEVMFHTGELSALKRWLDALPRQWQVRYPVIGFARAGLFAFSGAVDACIRCLDEVERHLMLAEHTDTRLHIARVNSVRCQIACFQNDLARAQAYADSAMQDLPEADHHYRANVHHSLGDAYRHIGRWEQARAQYLIVLDLVDDPAFRIRSVHVFGALADLELLQGRLRSAATCWSKALAVIQERDSWVRFPLPLTGWVYLRMGEVLYEWNELDAAGDHRARGLERAELGGDVRALIAGYVLAGRLQLAAGDIAAAEAYLERARPLVEDTSFPDWAARYGRLQLDIWLAQDRPQAANAWVGELLREMRAGRLQSAELQLAVARVLIVNGDVPALENALALLDPLLGLAGAEGRTGVAIEALALQALALGRRGDRTGAMTSLEHALRLAEPEGYVRLFADLRLPMGRLLQQARERDVMPAYVATLLAAYGTGSAGTYAVEQPLPEPLGTRELEVVRLLAAGLTNREIAARLVISSETVKKHAASIYGKLGVSNRTEAAARARELDLLT